MLPCGQLRLTGASALRLRAAIAFGGQGPLPGCAVMCEHVVQRDAALCCPAGN